MALTAIQGDATSGGCLTEAITAANLPGATAGPSQLATNLSTAVNSGSASPSGVGFTPVQIRTAYGLNLLPTTSGGAALDGTGQTVAIVDAYNDASIFKDLDAFDQQFGTGTTASTLFQQYGAAASFLTVLNQSGKAGPLAMNDPGGPSSSSWELEESLDIEAVHSIAPGAKIVLVEANTTGWSDLTTAALSASQIAGVSVVSMSWGISETGSGTSGLESSFDQSMAAVTGVSFVAATGDQGAAALYPSTSPNVVGVGGTTLNLNTDNSYASESLWSSSAGGFSQLEAKPAYQDSVLSSSQTKRSTPDVAIDGNPNTGIVVYDSYDNTLATPWSEEGGTSLGAPLWAGLIALADQGRQAAGNTNFDSGSPTETLSALYSLPQEDFHDITSGANKNSSATTGFDQVTGLGTPVANLLVPDLIAYGSAVSLSTSLLAAGMIGSPYAQSITANGGTGPKTMTYSVTAGTLPAGLAFDVSNSELDIVGTPSTAGSVTFNLTADDADGQKVTQSYVLTISALAAERFRHRPGGRPAGGWHHRYHYRHEPRRRHFCHVRHDQGNDRQRLVQPDRRDQSLIGPIGQPGRYRDHRRRHFHDQFVRSIRLRAGTNGYRRQSAVSANIRRHDYDFGQQLAQCHCRRLWQRARRDCERYAEPDRGDRAQFCRDRRRYRDHRRRHIGRYAGRRVYQRSADTNDYHYANTSERK